MGGSSEKISKNSGVIIMRERNIFITGGEVYGESMIGYKEQIGSLKRMINQKLNTTGGIYVYGLYRMGKTSLIKHIMPLICEENCKQIVVYINLNEFNTNCQNCYGDFLEGIILEIEDVLETIEDSALERVHNKISAFYQDDKASMKYRQSFSKIFRYIKKAEISVLLVVDEFDAAKDVFHSKADFELLRELTASKDYSVCLVTVSRQELSLIENENPNNSSFKGVMYPFAIKGFNDEDITAFCDVLRQDYDLVLSENDLTMIKSYCGLSPYLWSCIGYELAECQLLGRECQLEEILHSTAILSKIGGFHDSIFKCLEHDKDRKGVSFADKLVSAIIGPSFLASEEDIKLLTSMNYLIDTGSEYLAFSQSFKKYLMETTYNNDILNNFDTLEKKMKVLLESEKDNIFIAASAAQQSDDDNWYEVLSDTWGKIESKTFNNASYCAQIHSTRRRFHKNETVLNVMSLEDVMRIVRNYWTIFTSKFNNDTLDKWEVKLKECGIARNPIHHGSVKRIYTIEEQNRINSYCLEIIKQLS